MSFFNTFPLHFHKVMEDLVFDFNYFSRKGMALLPYSERNLLKYGKSCGEPDQFMMDYISHKFSQLKPCGDEDEEWIRTQYFMWYSLGFITSSTFAYLYNKYASRIMNSIVKRNSIVSNLMTLEEALTGVFSMLSNIFMIYSVVHFANKCATVADWSCLLSLVLRSQLGDSIAETFSAALRVVAPCASTCYIVDIVHVFVTFIAVFLTGFVNTNLVSNFFRWIGVTGLQDKIKATAQDLSYTVSYYILKFIVWATVDGDTVAKKMMSEFANDERKKSILSTKSHVLADMANHIIRFRSKAYDRITHVQLSDVGKTLSMAKALLQVMSSSKNLSIPEYNLIRTDFTKLSEYYMAKRKEISHFNRVEPVVLYLCGPGGTGKSTIMMHIRDKITNLCFPEYDGGHAGFAHYARCVDNKHWSDYKNQPIVTIDDVFQGKPDNNALEAREIIQLVSTAPMRTEGAAVDDKHQCFSSDFLFLTSNSSIPKVGSVDIGALTRRLAQNFVYVPTPTIENLTMTNPGISTTDLLKKIVLYRYKHTGRAIAFPAVRDDTGLFPVDVADVNRFRWFSDNFERISLNDLISKLVAARNNKVQIRDSVNLANEDDLDACGDSDSEIDSVKMERVVDDLFRDIPNPDSILYRVPDGMFTSPPASDDDSSSGDDAPSVDLQFDGEHFKVRNPGLKPVLRDDRLVKDLTDSELVNRALRNIDECDQKRSQFKNLGAANALHMIDSRLDDVLFNDIQTLVDRYPALLCFPQRRFIQCVSSLPAADFKRLTTLPQSSFPNVFYRPDGSSIDLSELRSCALAVKSRQVVDVSFEPLRVVLGVRAFNIDGTPVDGCMYTSIDQMSHEERTLLLEYSRQQVVKYTDGFSVWMKDGFISSFRSGLCYCTSDGKTFGAFPCQNFVEASRFQKLIHLLLEFKPSISDKLYSYYIVFRSACRDFVERLRKSPSLFRIVVASIAAVFLTVVGSRIFAYFSKKAKKACGTWADLVDEAVKNGELEDHPGDEYPDAEPQGRGVKIQNSQSKKSFSPKHGQKNKSKYNFHARGRCMGGEEVVESFVEKKSEERLVDLFCNHIVKLCFIRPDGSKMRMFGIIAGGGVVLTAKHLLWNHKDQSSFKFEVLADDKSFIEEVPRAHVQFPHDVKLSKADKRDYVAIYFRDMINKRDLKSHFTREVCNFGMFSRTVSAFVLKPLLRDQMPRISYVCPTCDVTSLVEQSYSDSKSDYITLAYKTKGLGAIAGLTSGDCGTPLLVKESGALRICGIFVAGDDHSQFVFQPVVKEDLEKLCDFSHMMKSKGFENFPGVKDGEPSLVNYPTPCLGVYEYDNAQMRCIPKTDLEPSCIGKDTPNLFGHAGVAAPAVLDIEAAQKAAIKKYHEGGTLDLRVIEQAKNWVESLYRTKIRDCHCGSVDDGFTGATHYGNLAQIDMKSSPGVPWTAFKPKNAKPGKQWLYVDGEPKPFVRKVCDEVMDSWSRGFAYPTVFKGSLKDEKRPHDRVAAKKTRIFTAGAFEKVVCDRALFGDFILQFKDNRLDLMHAYGVNAESLEWNDMAYMHRAMGNKHAAADYSGYDASLTAQLLSHAYEVVSRFYPEVEDKIKIDCSSVEARNHFVYMFGGLWQCAQGNPSGQVMTTVINSVVNHLLLSYAWIRHFTASGQVEMLDYYAWRKNFVVHVYGDDFVYTVSDKASSFDCIAYAAALRETGQELTAPDKSETIRAFIPWNQLTLLKRSFIPNPHGNKTIFVGPLEKEVIEEIPRWTHTGSTDDEMVSTLNSTLRMAALWGREYFDFIVSGLRQSPSACNLMGSLCVEDIFSDVVRPFRAATEELAPISVVAFYMADSDTREEHRFLSNLSNECGSFDYVVDGKTVKVHSSEQAYGLEKAMHFHDIQSFKKILSCGSPGGCASILHKIRDRAYIDSWNLVRDEIMKRVLMRKFSKPEYLVKLQSTGSSILVEASPRDIYWGSGLSVKESRLVVPTRYPGVNKLGQLLMSVREAKMV